MVTVWRQVLFDFDSNKSSGIFVLSRFEIKNKLNHVHV